MTNGSHGGRPGGPFCPPVFAMWVAVCGVAIAAVYFAGERPERPDVAAVPAAGRPPRLQEPTDALPVRTAAGSPASAQELLSSAADLTDLPLIGTPSADSGEARRVFVRTVADGGEPLDRLLADELPHASRSERDVWRDVLGGVPLSDAREIVRFRKNFGPPSRLTPADLTSADLMPPSSPAPAFETATEAAARPSAPRRPQTGSAERPDEPFQAILAVHRHNLLNMQTPGYLRLVPVPQEAADVGGVRLGDVRVDPASVAVEPRASDDPSDVAAPAGMFLRVRRGEATLLTRCGRAVVQNGRAGLTIGGQTLPLADQPPGEAADVSSWPVFQVDSPSGLRAAGNCLYDATDASGPATRSDGAALPGHTVAAAVEAETEVEALARWQALEAAASAERPIGLVAVQVTGE